MKQNPEIEICIESSAKENIRIRKVLEASRIAANYPSSPLFDQNRILKPQCMSALTRIFRLLDTDNDGCLSEEDVDSFEVYVTLSMCSIEVSIGTSFRASILVYNPIMHEQEF
ncbi:hypothetical protein AgCh_032513 [Apium graveolens]